VKGVPLKGSGVGSLAGLGGKQEQATKDVVL